MHMLLYLGVLYLQLDLFSSVVYVFSHAQSEGQAGSGCTTTACAPLGVDRPGGSTIGGGGYAHCIRQRFVERRLPASADRRAERPILEWICLFGTYAIVYVECHPSESPSLFTFMVKVMDLHRRHGGVAWCLYERFRCIHAMVPELPWHTINWDLAMDSTQCPIRLTVGTAGTAALSPRCGTMILECGSCASILSTAALAPVPSVGSGTSALRAGRTTDPSRTCHAVSAVKPI